MLDRREVDHSVGDHGVEARFLERELVDARLHEVDTFETAAVPQASRLADLLVCEVDSHDAAGLADPRAAQKTSVPEPEPRSSTRSPGAGAARSR
jgi:hypothetical protein